MIMCREKQSTLKATKTDGQELNGFSLSVYTTREDNFETIQDRGKSCRSLLSGIGHKSSHGGLISNNIANINSGKTLLESLAISSVYPNSSPWPIPSILMQLYLS